MSEYNYDEPLDEDNAKKFLNFGDDYRNFIDSMSESQSSIKDGTIYRRIKRRYRKKEVGSSSSKYGKEILLNDIFRWKMNFLLIVNQRQKSRMCSILLTTLLRK